MALKQEYTKSKMELALGRLKPPTPPKCIGSPEEVPLLGFHCISPQEYKFIDLKNPLATRH